MVALSPRTAAPLLLLLVVVVLVAMPPVPATPATVDAATQLLLQYDAVRVARCAVRCWTQAEDAKESCESAWCLETAYTKPGSCPAQGSTQSPFDGACIEACAGDAQCSAVDKCCRHACGVTCQQALGLDAEEGLPATPQNVTAEERRQGRTVVVQWSMAPGAELGTAPGTATPGTGGVGRLVYVLEERHHVGRYLSLDRLEDASWTPRHRSSRPTATLRAGTPRAALRPGRWYQFRVAAVNANGTRGFSQPSQPFKLVQGPRAPGEPHNLTVRPLPADGEGALAAELKWAAPPSDLPIDRYKVFWSQRLEGHESVLVHHQALDGDIEQFELRGLEQNSLYFLQVQAITQYGRERLKGPKAAMVLNTKDLETGVQISSSNTSTETSTSTL